MGGEPYIVAVNRFATVAHLQEKVYDEYWAQKSPHEYQQMRETHQMNIYQGNIELGKNQRLCEVLELSEPPAEPTEHQAQVRFVLFLFTDECPKKKRDIRTQLAEKRDSKGSQLVELQGLSKNCLGRSFMQKVAHGLHVGRHVAPAQRLVVIQKLQSGQTFESEAWCWSLFYDSNKSEFVWRHRKACNGKSDEQIFENWKAKEEFIDWWAKMTERSLGAYAATLLLGKDGEDFREAIELRGTPSKDTLASACCEEPEAKRRRAL